MTPSFIYKCSACTFLIPSRTWCVHATLIQITYSFCGNCSIRLVTVTSLRNTPCWVAHEGTENDSDMLYVFNLYPYGNLGSELFTEANYYCPHLMNVFITQSSTQQGWVILIHMTDYLMTLCHTIHDNGEFDKLWRANWTEMEQGIRDDLNDESTLKFVFTVKQVRKVMHSIKIQLTAAKAIRLKKENVPGTNDEYLLQYSLQL